MKRHGCNTLKPQHVSHCKVICIDIKVVIYEQNYIYTNYNVNGYVINCNKDVIYIQLHNSNSVLFCSLKKKR